VTLNQCFVGRSSDLDYLLFTPLVGMRGTVPFFYKNLVAAFSLLKVILGLSSPR